MKLKNPKEQVYYTNLALAYKANNQFQQSIETINEMLRNTFAPSSNYNQLIKKGKVIKGRSINEIIKNYILSNQYTNSQSQEMLKRIQQAISMFQEIKKDYKSVDVNEFLNNSLKTKIYLQKIKKKTSEIEVVHYLKRKIQESNKGLTKQKNWQKIASYFKSQKQLLRQIELYYDKCHKKFIQQAEQDQQYLIDPITYQKYKEPVVVPSGISYEQNTLKEYFKTHQYRDPITKQQFQVGEKVMVRNNSLKNYISEMGKIHQIRKEDIELLVC